jgi:uncharacterized repeat protein (TIGR01451 family)
VGWLYNYDVDAIGNPVPTYALTTGSTGMMIDGNTGLISWTPDVGQEGSHNVEVEASNSEGTDTQTFSINVAEAGPCPVGMISYWKLDETSGSTFDDYYNGNDASCSTDHCPDFATGGRVSGALDFDGTSDYLTAEDDDSLDWASDASFTIELWAKFSNVSSKNKVMIGRDQSGGTHWWLGAKQDSGTAHFSLRATDGSGGSITGYTPTNDGQWHHIVAVKDGSTNRLYVDGIEEDSETYVYTAGFDATTTLGIGYMAYHGTPDFYYDGLLDEIGLYSVALSKVEIQQHYQNGLGELGHCASIAIAKEADQTVVSGSTVTFTISVTNTGVVDMENVTVTDALAPDCDEDRGRLDAGHSASYTCTVAEVVTDFINSATVTGTTFLGIQVTDTDTASVHLIQEGEAIYLPIVLKNFK